MPVFERNILPPSSGYKIENQSRISEDFSGFFFD
jgi:hypothetical protein